MKLDPRIILLTDIITCFDEDRPRAKNYVGQMGYFSDDMMEFNNLESCIYGELNIIDDDKYPFNCNNGDGIDHAFFIPESVLKPKPKKKVEYRPFANTKEFFIKTNFEEGDVIRIRSKPHNTEYYTMLVGWTDKELMLGSLRIAFLTELFEKFELWDGEDKFIPFGMEVEE